MKCRTWSKRASRAGIRLLRFTSTFFTVVLRFWSIARSFVCNQHFTREEAHRIRSSRKDWIWTRPVIVSLVDKIHDFGITLPFDTRDQFDWVWPGVVWFQIGSRFRSETNRAKVMWIAHECKVFWNFNWVIFYSLSRKEERNTNNAARIHHSLPWPHNLTTLTTLESEKGVTSNISRLKIIKTYWRRYSLVPCNPVGHRTVCIVYHLLQCRMNKTDHCRNSVQGHSKPPTKISQGIKRQRRHGE